MKKKIFYAIFLGILGTQLLSMLCIIVFQNMLITRQTFTQLTHIIKHIDYDALKQILDANHILLDDTQRLTLISLQGQVLYDSVANTESMDNHLHREEIQSVLAYHNQHSEQNAIFIASRVSHTLKTQNLYVAKIVYPLDDAKEPIIVRLSEEKRGIGAIVLLLLPYLSLLFIGGFIFSSILAILLSKRIVRPLQNIKLSSPLKTNPYPELFIFMRKIAKQKKKIKKQLNTIKEQENQKEIFRRQFSANVTHELKTPLSVILASSEMLKNGLVKPQDEKTFIVKIYTESKRLLTLIDKILRLSFFDENTLELEKTPLDIGEILRRVSKNLTSLAESKHIVIDLQIPHLQRDVCGVSSLIEDMVYNLIENAIKYSFEKSRINVQLKECENELELVISDNGIGIAKEEQERVFERFYCVDKSRSKKLGGSGLGLSIVQHIAQIHKANIKLESELGLGTTITIAFPYGKD